MANGKLEYYIGKNEFAYDKNGRAIALKDIGIEQIKRGVYLKREQIHKVFRIPVNTAKVRLRSSKDSMHAEYLGKKMKRHYLFNNGNYLAFLGKNQLDIDIQKNEEISEKINEGEKYTIPEILKITDLSTDILSRAIYNGSLKYNIFKRDFSDRAERPLTGYFFISGSSLKNFLNNGRDKKTYIPTRREEKIKEILYKNNEDIKDLLLPERLLLSPVLKYEEETELLKKVRETDILARDNLVEGNYKLVAKILRKYISKSHNLDFWDLFQEGCTGLIYSIDKYNIEKTNKLGERHKFATYASDWIIQSIERAIDDKGTAIRAPYHISVMEYKIVNFTKEFYKRFHKEPSIKEIHKETDISKKDIVKIRSIERHVVSLNEVVGSEEKSELQDFISDEKISTGLQNLIDDTYKKEEFLKRAEKILSERDYKIICLKLGMNGNDMSLREVGEIYRISRERIRQIVKKSVKKLKTDFLIRDIFGQNEAKSNCSYVS